MDNQLVSFSKVKAIDLKYAYDKAIENMDDSIIYSSHTIAVGKVILPDSRVAEVHITLTTDEDEFLM